MNQKQDSSGNEIRRAEPLEVYSTHGVDTTGIGAGKKNRLYIVPHTEVDVVELPGNKMKNEKRFSRLKLCHISI